MCLLSRLVSAVVLPHPASAVVYCLRRCCRLSFSTSPASIDSAASSGRDLMSALPASHFWKWADKSASCRHRLCRAASSLNETAERYSLCSSDRPCCSIRARREAGADGTWNHRSTIHPGPSWNTGCTPSRLAQQAFTGFDCGTSMCQWTWHSPAAEGSQRPVRWRPLPCRRKAAASGWAGGRMTGSTAAQLCRAGTE